MAESVSLVITVDNGSSAHSAMVTAKRRGINVIVTDHEILADHPETYWIDHPYRWSFIIIAILIIHHS
ncbi:hypothetical protein C7R92_02095 [Brevibacillus porteri]|uniref:DDH domain-containing protein n=1 Tax=Brevibacillus porteri TaxID=2126350 RepID=A0ABX5G0B4_9BACL|nr:hypothetical protein C7R92_02095 [Brevibacillus porteri]